MTIHEIKQNALDFILILRQNNTMHSLVRLKVFHNQGHELKFKPAYLFFDVATFQRCQLRVEVFGCKIICVISFTRSIVIPLRCSSARGWSVGSNSMYGLVGIGRK